ncbi:hypothetical protein DFH06DRAFT_1131672 [Mycena polygramma]|nr:hypothetical protein DFH06DRAFT_1131672 [Mycena polygramma]
MHGRRRSPTEGTECRTSPGTQGKGRGMSETVGGNRAELGLEGMDQSRTEGKVQAWAKSVEERPKPRGQDFGGSTEVGEEIRSSTNQASDSDRHQEGDATGRAIGPGTGPRTQSIAERRRTEGGVGEKREEGNREIRTYCTKAAVSGTSLYGSRPRPRVSARPEGEERRWLPEPDTGEGEGCGCIGTPGVTIAGTSLYGSRPHPQGAELWSAEHREAGRLLRRGYRKRMVARVRSTTKRGREGRTTGLLVVRRRRSNPQRAGGLRRAKPGGNTGPRGRPLTLEPERGSQCSSFPLAIEGNERNRKMRHPSSRKVRKDTGQETVLPHRITVPDMFQRPSRKLRCEGRQNDAIQRRTRMAFEYANRSCAFFVGPEGPSMCDARPRGHSEVAVGEKTMTVRAEDVQSSRLPARAGVDDVRHDGARYKAPSGELQKLNLAKYYPPGHPDNIGTSEPAQSARAWAERL